MKSVLFWHINYNTINSNCKPINFDVDGDTTLDKTDIAGDLTVVGRGIIDNILINGNNISATNSNGHVELQPDGNGDVRVLFSDLNVDENTNIGGNLTVTGTAMFDGVARPLNNTVESLGNTSHRWGQLWVDNILIDGSEISAAMKSAGAYASWAWITVTSEVGGTFNTIVLNGVSGSTNPGIAAIEIGGEKLETGACS